MAPNRDVDSGRKQVAVIFGATSLVGRYLADRLADAGYEGLCLSRSSKPNRYEAPPGFSWRTISKDEGLNVPPSAALFSLVPMSALPALLGRTSGAGRLIALSTSSVFFKAESSDPAERRMVRSLKKAEADAQAICRDREMAWTIFRPTLVYDFERDRNVSAIAAFVRRYHVFPIVWPGTGRRQPIHADDVARAMVAAASVPAAHGAIFDLPGGETLTYREMIRRIFESSGKRPVLLYLPLGLARTAFRLWRTVTRADYSTASLERMNMDLTLDAAPVTETLGITCRPFAPGLPHPPESPARASPADRTGKRADD